MSKATGPRERHLQREFELALQRQKDDIRNAALDEVVAMVGRRADTLESLEYPCSEAVHQFVLGLGVALEAMKR